MLAYNSQHAHPTPTVYADSLQPTTVQVLVRMSDGTVHQASYPGSQFLPGMTRRVGVQWDGLNTATGLHRYTLQVVNVYSTASLASDTVPGELAVVNRSNSAFGAGWWLAGWEQFICVDCYSANQRWLWVGGDGSTRVYTGDVDVLRLRHARQPSSVRTQMGASANAAMDLTTGIVAAESRGVALAGSTDGASVSTSTVYTRLDGPRPQTDVLDHTYIWLNRDGTIRRTRDPVGAETRIRYGDGRFPALATEVTAPSGVYTRAWYDAEGRTVASTVFGQYLPTESSTSYMAWDPVCHKPTMTTSPATGVFEEYRYDPLGRRVAVRTLRPQGLCNQPAECYNSITYFVWAGDQLLWEIRDTDASADPETRGRVSYFQAGGIDRPLTIWKQGVGTVVTHQSWRRQFARGTFGVGPKAGQSRDCTEYPATNGCIPVQWPGWNTTAWSQEAAKPNTTGSDRFWFGSLSVGMRDASGQTYMRNRYYNAQTGQFTQPDPIGLAGGLNSYGFAAGDPVSYSDPYGLQACHDAQGVVIPCPEPAGPPPVPLPGGRTWRPAAGQSSPGATGGSRGKRWVPSSPLPGGVPQPGASWDPSGHWDVDNLPGSAPGKKGRRRFTERGREVTHDRDDIIGPQQYQTTAVAVGATVGVGYLLYRGVRLLPSLVPVLWPTLPANLAIP